MNYSFVKRIILKPGDKIILGRIILKYEHRDLAEKQFFDEIYRFATVDSMTSLHNKSAIIQILEDEITVNLRDQQWLSVVRIDIDKFKNDGHGNNNKQYSCHSTKYLYP